jgi:hypothetical protein
MTVGRGLSGAVKDGVFITGTTGSVVRAEQLANMMDASSSKNVFFIDPAAILKLIIYL